MIEGKNKAIFNSDNKLVCNKCGAKFESHSGKWTYRNKKWTHQCKEPKKHE